MTPAVSLSLLWMAHFLVDFMLGIWAVFKTMSVLDLGIAGIFAALSAVIGEGAQVLFGNLSDRGHRNRLILAGIILAMSNLFLVFTQSYAFVLLLSILTCVGSGAFHPTSVSLIGSLTKKQKSFYISIFSSGGALGMALSQTIFSHTYFYFDGHTWPLMLPVLLLIACLLFFGFCKRNEVSQSGGMALNLQVFKNYFSTPATRHLYVMQVCNQTIAWATIFLLPDILLTRGYEDNITFGGGHFAFIIGSVFMMLPSGYIADRFTPRTVILVAGFLGMIFYYLFLLNSTLSSLYLIPLLLLAGAFMGVVQPLAVALGNELGKEHPGLTGFFTMGLVWCISETMGPAGSGLLSKLFEEDAPAKALMVIGLLYPVMIYFTYRLPLKEPAFETIPIDD